ncbi:MAG: hypothetical protein IPN71_06540 [Fibrobacteres bacterium]|jgi:hypothetical protein|nr:hypothetical protein [Fibrobacterota bacterium]
MKIFHSILLILIAFQGTKMSSFPKVNYQTWLNHGRLDLSRVYEPPPDDGSGTTIRSGLSFSADEWVDLEDSSPPKMGIQELGDDDEAGPQIVPHTVLLASDLDSDHAYYFLAGMIPGTRKEYRRGNGLVDLLNLEFKETTIKELPWEELGRKRARFRVWALAPDFVMGPLEMGIGSHRLTHAVEMEALNMVAEPRTVLPSEFQFSERTWVDLGMGLGPIPEGINLSWDEEDPEHPKLLLSFNLPWNPRDQVQLDVHPSVLEGLDVPEGIKTVRLIGMSRAGPLSKKIALPAVPNGLGRCFGRVSVDLKKTNSFLNWVPITHLYAVSGGDLGGPLLALPKAFPKDSWNE